MLAFLVPLAVRTVPEVLAGPYPLGFDTVVYYLPAMVQQRVLCEPVLFLLSRSSLVYVLLRALFLLFKDPILVLKLIAPLLHGLLGLAVYVYTLKGVGWSPRLSFLTVLLATGSLGALRVSWDMHRNSLGLVFLFFALAALKSGERRIKLLAAPLAFLNTWVYEVTSVYMILIFGFILAIKLSRKELRDIPYVLLALAASLPLLLYQWTNGPGSLVVHLGVGFPPSAETVWESVYFILFLHVSLLPLAALGFRHLRDTEMVLWTLLTLLFAVSLPAFGLQTIAHYRFAFMLSYPLAFSAAAGASALTRGDSKSSRRVVWALVLLPLVVGASYAVSSPLAPFLYTMMEPRFYYYMPTGMLQNVVPVERTGDLLEALRWLDRSATDHGVTLLPAQFYGLGLITLNSPSRVEDVGEFSPFSPHGVDRLLNRSIFALENGASVVYTVWWKPGHNWYGVGSLPDVFRVVRGFGDFAVYKYAGES